MSQNNGSKYESLLSIGNIPIVAAGIFGAAGIALILMRYRNKRGVLNIPNIVVVNTKEDCVAAVAKIRNKISKHKVLGFDCEWVTQNGSRHPVALLQLASYDGCCTLIRLCNIQYVPIELKALLEDSTILKVGVAPSDDAKYLKCDYAIDVKGIIDLRYLSIMLSESPMGLSSMSERYLGITLDKHWRIRCSDWEANSLTTHQVKYAAADAYVAIKIFRNLIDRILGKENKFLIITKLSNRYWNLVEEVCSKFLNMRFKLIQAKKLEANELKTILSPQQQLGLTQSSNRDQRRKYTCQTRTKIAYENCYMQTADGDVLCTCERKKAEWYVEKNLAEVLNQEPFTIKLKFEPAGRSVGEVGIFYKNPRANQCVVCGQSHSCIKKNIIPKEYRRLFPVVMKDHSSHDVLLLCITCHQISNIKDQILRNKLAITCDAPFGSKDNVKYLQSGDLKKIKSAARALLLGVHKHNIPIEKVAELEKVLLDSNPDVTEINKDFLEKMCNLESNFENISYISHGEKVVQRYIDDLGGLLMLERMWRQHFLDTMNPQYMPMLWSITHTQSRLQIRQDEGRVSEEDLILSGMKSTNKRDIVNSNEKRL